MAETGESSHMRDEEFQSVPIVCEESPIAARAVAVESIPLMKQKESKSEKLVDELSDVLEESLLDGLLDQNIELENKVNVLEERIHELETQVMEYQKELGLGFEKESDKRELIQAWARVLVQNTANEVKIRELEATIKELQSEKPMKVEEKKDLTKQKRKKDKSKPKDNKLKKKKKIETCVNYGKAHLGVCLKGRRVCYRCGQNGHITPNCTKKQGCYNCGAADHQFKKCKQKGNLGGQSTPQFGKPSCQVYVYMFVYMISLLLCACVNLMYKEL